MVFYDHEITNESLWVCPHRSYSLLTTARVSGNGERVFNCYKMRISNLRCDIYPSPKWQILSRNRLLVVMKTLGLATQMRFTYPVKTRRDCAVDETEEQINRIAKYHAERNTPISRMIGNHYLGVSRWNNKSTHRGPYIFNPWRLSVCIRSPSRTGSHMFAVYTQPSKCGGH
jgi:hypothetical protein